MSDEETQSNGPAKMPGHSVTLYLFPGIKPEAKISGDRHLYDVSCPYCESEGDCTHLLALIDPLNYSLDGRASGLDREFSHRIRAAFLRLLGEGKTELEWESEEITELWEWAEGNWSDGDEEVAIDEDVLFRLLIEALEMFASHVDSGSLLEGFGVETEYTFIYDDDPVRVIDEAIQYLDRILIPTQ
jgi:hypothetical protein